MKRKNKSKKVIRQKVPSLKLKLSLIGSSIVFIVIAFLAGVFLATDSKSYYTISGLNSLLDSAGIEKTFLQNVPKLNQVYLDSLSKQLLKNEPIQGVYLLKQGGTTVFWSKEKAGKVATKDILALINVKQNSSKSSYFLDVESKGFYFIKYHKDLFLVMRLKPFPKPLFRGLFESQQIRFLVILEQSFTQLILFVALIIVLLFLVIYSIIYFLVVSPVKSFIALIDAGKPGRKVKVKGLLAGGHEHLRELMNMRNDQASATELEGDLSLLSRREGYDFTGLNAGGFFLQRNKIAKEHCEIFPISDSLYGLFLGEISGRDAENQINIAKIFWLAKSMSYSYKNPALVVNELNRFLYMTKFEKPVNLFMGFLNTKDNSLTFSQAGGIPLYKFTDSGKGNSYHLDTPPAGLIEPDSFKEVVSYAKLPLLKGDVISLFTDGIIKIADFDWENEVEKILSSKETLGEKIMKLKSRLDEASLSSKNGDDIATLFVQI